MTMNMDDYENKGGHNDTPPTSPRPEPPKGQSDSLLVPQEKIKRSECPYGGIDCAWCLEDCE